jgi:hypothetical protein
MSVSENLRHPVVSALRALNNREQGVNSWPKRRITRAERTAAFRAAANLNRYYKQLDKVHEAIKELGHDALDGVLEVELAEIEIIRPLWQDRLHNKYFGSKKYSRLDTGQGFTMHQYIHGEEGVGTNHRRFHVVGDSQSEGVPLRGIALPYVLESEPNIHKRLATRRNSRPEDLAIALDDSQRTWAGVYIPHGVADRGVKHAPIFGVVEDPKIGSSLDRALENHLAFYIEPGTTADIGVTTKTAALEDVEKQIREIPRQGPN